MFNSKTGWICFMLLFTFSVKGESTLDKLYDAIEQAAQYDQQKTQDISVLKKQLKSLTDPTQRITLLALLSKAYQNFNYDSSFTYSIQRLNAAYQTRDVQTISDAKIQFGNICVAAGVYNEGLDTMLSINIEEVRPIIKPTYYSILGRYYYEMAVFTDVLYYSNHYFELANQYRTQAYHYSDDRSFFKGYVETLITPENTTEKLKALIANYDLNLRDNARIHCNIGENYIAQNQKDSAIYYLAEAAISDIKSSTKENLAFLRLAELLFEKGDLNGASILIRKANEDAMFFGARQRKIQVGAVLPLIEEAVIQKINQQRQRLYWQNIGLIGLLLAVLILGIIIYRQVVNLREAKNKLDQTNQELKRINQILEKANQEKIAQNELLQTINLSLKESNKVKEKYIGLLFFREATWFNALQTFKTKTQELLEKGTLKKAKYFVRDYDVSTPKTESLYNFDKAFIELFPNFIKEFNTLFEAENKVQLEEGELLNNETRIFALIRLGITHNEKIAQILGLSVNTVYAYKSKIRNRSKLDSKAFDKKLVEVTTIKV